MTNNKVTNDFRKFGSAMKIVAIMSILETLIVIPVFTLIGLIYTVIAMNHIRDVNRDLKSPLLDKYRSQSIVAIILRFISGILIIIWWLIFVDSDIFTTLIQFPLAIFYLFNILESLPLFTAVVCGVKLIQGIIEINAWKNLKEFLMNKDWIQPGIRYELIEGCDNLKKAGITEILSFLAITIFLGWLYRMTGYFKIAKFENLSEKGEMVHKDAIPSQRLQSIESPKVEQTPNKEPDIKYCPFCGTKLPLEAKFCGGCGTNLNSDS